MNIGDGNIFAFVNNNPLDNMDYLGLLTPQDALEAAWEAAKAGADYVGEEVSLLEIFGGCRGLGVSLAYAETQEQDCMNAAITGPPSQGAAGEAACQKQWSGKIAMMLDIRNKECKCTAPPETKHWWWPF